MTPELQPDSSAWSEANSKATLKQLRLDYPGYSVNELYAIWCNKHGRIPLDHNGKLILEQWQIHAATDGEHVQEGGFRVSPAFLGRARKAVPGKPKPKSAPRRRVSAREPDLSSFRGAFSTQAEAFGRAYDRSVVMVPSLLAAREEYKVLLRELVDLPKGVLSELVSNMREAESLLREASLLRLIRLDSSGSQESLTESE